MSIPAGCSHVTDISLNMMVCGFLEGNDLQPSHLYCKHRGECLLFSGHSLAALRSVILPSIIQKRPEGESYWLRLTRAFSLREYDLAH